MYAGHDFDVWLTRLECIVCGRSLNGSRAHFHALADGLMWPEDKRLASSEISIESRALAAQVFRAPVENFVGIPWPKSRAADLRKFLIQILQRHIEEKLVTAGMLENLVSMPLAWGFFWIFPLFSHADAVPKKNCAPAP